MFWAARGRKKNSALELRDEGDKWVLYRGGENNRAFGTLVTILDVTNVGVAEADKSLTPELLLSIVDGRGLTSECLRIPERLLASSPLLCSMLLEMSKDDFGDISDEAVRMLAEHAAGFGE